MAMTQVVLKGVLLERQTPYFHDYVTRYTDLPLVVRLKKDGDSFGRTASCGPPTWGCTH